jgi:hypothetical protein
MKEIPLTRGYVAIVDDEDYAGLSRFKWCALCVTSPNLVYAVRNSRQDEGKRHLILMHRQIMGFPKLGVDHWDGDGLHNWRGNLRTATQSQNLANQRLLNSKSGMKGVSWSRHAKKWNAHIQANKVQYNLGLYADKEDAARAYDAAATKLFGEFARPNFPTPSKDEP